MADHVLALGVAGALDLFDADLRVKNPIAVKMAEIITIEDIETLLNQELLIK
jgi:hypothetical protein